MPVPPSAANRSWTSNLPSPSASRSPMTAPGLPCAFRIAMKRSPLAAAAICRPTPRLSAATSAQKPDGSDMPPLSGAHAGGVRAASFDCARSAMAVHAMDSATAQAGIVRFMARPHSFEI
jgi:hypothetical protein